MCACACTLQSDGDLIGIIGWDYFVRVWSDGEINNNLIAMNVCNRYVKPCIPNTIQSSVAFVMPVNRVQICWIQLNVARMEVIFLAATVRVDHRMQSDIVIENECCILVWYVLNIYKRGQECQVSVNIKHICLPVAKNVLSVYQFTMYHMWRRK